MPGNVLISSCCAASSDTALPRQCSDKQHFSEHGVRWAQSQSVISLAAARSADRVPEEALSQLLGAYTSSVPSELSAMSGYEELQKLLQEPDLQV